MSDVTCILTAIEQGDPHAADELLLLVYEGLRKLAASGVCTIPASSVPSFIPLLAASSGFSGVEGEEPLTPGHVGTQSATARSFFAPSDPKEVETHSFCAISVY